MNTISISELRRFSTEKIEQILPAIVSFEGEGKYMFCPKDDVIVLADLHPRVQKQFRALEQQVRRGMPAPVKLYGKDVKEILGQPATLVEVA